MTTRPLSQALAEGDGISIVVEVHDAGGARAAEEQGAEAVALRAAVEGVQEATALPVLWLGGGSPAEARAAGADALVLDARDEPARLEALWQEAAGHGLECVVRVRDDEELARVLELLDPEILLLSAERAEDEQLDVERVLELLPDVPVGKLAIAELVHASREEIEELERAGVDAVLVAAGDVSALVG